MKKVLVVSDRDATSLFSHLQPDHQVVHCKPADALVRLATEDPQIVFCIAEHEGRQFSAAYTTYKDLRLSISEGVKLVRLGFLKTSDDSEIYLRLPVTADDVRACIEGSSKGVLDR